MAIKFMKNFNDEYIPELERIIKDAKNKILELSSMSLHFNEIFIKNDKGHMIIIKDILEKYSIVGKSRIGGIYMFKENGKPIYIGISRNIFRRLRDHFLGINKNSASLAFLVSKKHKIDIQKVQENMRKNWTISFLIESNSYKLALMEIFASSHYKTFWNSFKTH